jgi:hypothetical protein
LFKNHTLQFRYWGKIIRALAVKLMHLVKGGC